MTLRAFCLSIGAAFLVSCTSVPSAPGVDTASIRKGIVGTWESHDTAFGVVGSRLKKCYRADGTAESWVSSRVRSGSVATYNPPTHLTSRWRVEGDTVIMWDYRENSLPSTRFKEFRDKIVSMKADHYVFYSYDHHAQRPATVYRTTKSIADPF